jgi:diadenosine tetraphosphatase ApaH/serine/threonine PP2A family protein phosphatase
MTMRYLVISDIHGNLEALNTVLAVVDGRYDKVLVLGDLVGYGADPNAVIDRVRELEPHTVIRGNHDKVAAGLDDGESFNSVARSAVQWTYEALTPANREYLAGLPAGPQAVDDLVEICHGTPFDEDAYLFDDLDALRAFEAASRPVCLFGHTHVAVGFRYADTTLEIVAGPGDTAGLVLQFEPDARYLINAGSVGQPRDGDPRAGAAIVDVTEQRIELFRIPYPVEEAQRKIRLAGLPEVLAKRLSLGR